MIRFFVSDTKRRVEKTVEEYFAAEYDKDKKYIFLVPDRRTLEWEKRLHSAINAQGSFNIEVCSFRRLAQKLTFSEAPVLSPEGAVMLMSKAIMNVKDKLVYFKGAGNGSTRNIYSTITAMRSSDITVDKLLGCLDGLDEGLKKKTQDLALIYNQYLKLLKEGHSDGTTRLEALSELLSKQDYTFSAVVWATGFNCFNARQTDVLQKLYKKTGSLNVALPCLSSDADNDRYYDTSSFFKLKKFAEDNSYNCKVIKTKEAFTAPGKIIYDNLYSYNADFCGEKGYFDLIYSSATEEEVKALAVMIRQLVLKGVRYKNIGVTVTDVLKYKKYLEKFLPLYDVPYHLDAPESLSGHALLSFTLNLFTAAKNNFKREDVLRLLKSPYINCEYDKKCVFENYVLKNNVNYNYFFTPFDDEDAEYVRKIIALPLAAAKELLALKTLDLCVDKLRGIYDLVQAERRSSELALEESLNGFDREAEISAHIYGRVSSLLDDMKSLLAQAEGGSKFAELFKDTVAGESISLLPVSPDCVLFRTPENSDFDGVDHLFILGASAGAFPMETGDSPIITLKDSRAWFNNNVELKPTVKDDLKNQMFEILQLLSGSYKHITALYSKEGTDGAGASFIVKTLAGLFGAEQIPAESVYSAEKVTDKDRLLSVMGNETNAAFEMTEYDALVPENERINAARDVFFASLRAFLQKEKLLIRPVKEANGKLNMQKQELSELFFNGGHASVTKLERYFKCPYYFFLTDGLHLKERDLPEAQANDKGTIIHRALAEFFAQNKRTYYSDNDQADDVALRAVTDKIIEDVIINNGFLKFFKDKRGEKDKAEIKKETFDLIKKLVLFSNKSSFKTKPEYCEFKIDKIGLVAYSDDQTRIVYRGSIDRIDESENKKVVLDYKTGKVDGSFNELYFGEKLQLFIYIKALTFDGNSVPCGVFYIPISAKAEKSQGEENDEKKDKKLFKGWYTDQIEADFSPEFTQGKVLSPQAMQNCIDYAYTIAQNAILEILGGFIEKKPAEGACSFCPIKDLCTVCFEGKYRKVTGATTFFDEKK